MRRLALTVIAVAVAGLLPAQQRSSESSRQVRRQRATATPAPRAPQVSPTPTPAATARSAETTATEGQPGQGFTYQQTSDTRVMIGYSIGAPLEYYEFKNNTLSWREAMPSETNSISVIVREQNGERFIPESKVSAGVADTTGKEVITTATLGLLWHPEGYRYAANISAPEGTATSGTLHLKVEPPDFARADKQQGSFFSDTLTASWPNVTISPAAKKAEATTGTVEVGSFGEGRHPPYSPTPYPGSVR